MAKIDLELFYGKAPTDEELVAAPLVNGWILKDHPAAKFGAQIWGWFSGHPTVGEGNFGHSSPVTVLDLATPPLWARTESRLYRLGDVYGPIEMEIRLLARSLRINGERTKQDDIEDEIEARNDPDGGWPSTPLDEVEQMMVNMRRFRKGRVTPEKLDGLLSAYRSEKYPPSPEDLARWGEDNE